MTSYDGTEDFNSNQVATAQKINQVVVWKGTALPVGAANKVPQYGLFLLVDSLSAPTTRTWYIQISATLSSPNFVEIPDLPSGDELPYIPLSETIGDYSSPNAAVATSEYVDSDTLDSTTRSIDNSGAATSNALDFAVDLGAGVIPDDDYEFRFPLNVTAFTARGDTNTQNSFIGLSSTNGIPSTTRDGIGLFMRTHSGAGNKFYVSISNGAALGNATTEISGYDLQTGQIYVKITKLSGTVTVSLYSGSDYSTGLVGSDTRTVTTNNGVIQTSTTSLTLLVQQYADYVFDDDTAKYWQSDDEASPAIYVDLSGSAREIVALALNINTSVTTITAIKIRASTDTTFSDAENIAYVNISDFTDNVWRFIANNLLADNRRYVQVIGVGTGILAIYEIKARYGISDTVKLLTHKHRTRTVDSADSFNDVDD